MRRCMKKALKGKVGDESANSSEKNQEALWAGLNQGLVRVVATDHCPFTGSRKKWARTIFQNSEWSSCAGAPHGTALFRRGVRTGKISLNKYVEVTSTNAAKIFGCFREKARFLSAQMLTSSFLTRTKSIPFLPRPITTTRIIPLTKAGK